MKKLFSMICAVLMSTALMAQEGSMFVGANVNYGVYSNRNEFGLGAKFQYEFIDQWRGEASANYYFEQNDISTWDFSANVHYILPMPQGFNIYPLAGVCFDYIHTYREFIIKSSDTEVPLQEVFPLRRNHTRLGLNLGGGIEYPLNNQFKVNAEVKYQLVQGYNRPVISLGVSYAI